MIILAWNRDYPNSWDEYDDALRHAHPDGDGWATPWNVGRRRNIQEGTDCFLLSQGRKHPRGLIGRGFTLSEPYPAEHFARAGELSLYVDVLFTELLPPESVIPLEYLSAKVPGVPWTKGIRGSGYQVAEAAQPYLNDAWIALGRRSRTRESAMECHMSEYSDTSREDTA